MLKQLDLSEVLFLDIETVSGKPNFEDLSPEWQKLWDEKTRFQRGENKTAEDYYPERAGILAEFGKIVCVSMGYFDRAHGQGRRFLIKSFFGENENELLEEVCQVLHKKSQMRLCAHNGKEFDFPYLCRRLLINGLEIPGVLNLQGKKPWEVHHLDTMELWRFGDYKNFTSLKLLTQCLGIESSKNDIDGSEVGRVFWQENDLERIARYCAQDVKALAQILLKMRQESLLAADEVAFLGLS